MIVSSFPAMLDDDRHGHLQDRLSRAVAEKLGGKPGRLARRATDGEQISTGQPGLGLKTAITAGLEQRTNLMSEFVKAR
jgi:hypothetical protein